MIEAKELMRGVWLQYNQVNGSKEYRQVKSISEKFINGDPIEHFDYIGLSPEILEKAGFVYDECTFTNGAFMLAKGAIQWQVWLHGLHAGETTRIKYVHELQNLFYCINGSELPINLNQ
jgi:hypothetical protein